jgi:hypothetical protein
VGERRDVAAAEYPIMPAAADMLRGAQHVLSCDSRPPMATSGGLFAVPAWQWGKPGQACSTPGSSGDAGTLLRLASGKRRTPSAVPDAAPRSTLATHGAMAAEIAGSGFRGGSPCAAGGHIGL